MIGVQELEQLPYPHELPPPQTRCCVGCNRHNAVIYVGTVFDDLSCAMLPFCARCWEIGLGAVPWEDLADDIERRFAERVITWVENFWRKKEKPPLPGGRTGIYAGLWEEET